MVVKLWCVSRSISRGRGETINWGIWEGKWHRLDFVYAYSLMNFYKSQKTQESKYRKHKKGFKRNAGSNPTFRETCVSYFYQQKCHFEAKLI